MELDTHNDSRSAAAGRCAAARRTPPFLRVATLWFVLSLATRSFAQPLPPPEHQVKAAIVANLAKYVDWPSQAFASSNSPLVLAIIAPANIEIELRKMITGKAVGGHALELLPLAPQANGSPTAHILFISGLERKQTADLLRNYQGQPVLTVVEDEGDRPAGGIITLLRRDNKVRLEINATAAKEAGLAISSKLLGVADTTKGRTK